MRRRRELVADRVPSALGRPTRVVLPPPRRPGDRSSARSGPSQTISEEGVPPNASVLDGEPQAVRHSKSASQIVLIFICLSLEAQ